MGLSLGVLYSLAEQYGIPSQVVSAILAFALVLLLGRPIINLFLRITFKRMSELSEETRSSYVGLIHIAALILVTLAALLSPPLAAGLAAIMLIGIPLAVGVVATRGSTIKTTAVRPPEQKRERDERLRRALNMPVKREEKKDVKKAQEKSNGEKRLKIMKIRLKIPFFGKSSRKGEKKKSIREKRAEQKEKSEPTLVVEEIRVPTPPMEQPRSIPAPQPSKDEKTPRLPPADKIKREEFLKAVAELESQVSGTQAPRAVQPPPRPQPQIKSIPTKARPVLAEEKYVEQVAKVVEQKVVQSRKHKFVTWREALEMRRRAKEAVQRMKPVMEKKVKETLKRKGKLTREDLDAIAEEILYQVQKGDVFAQEDVPKPAKEEKGEKKEEKRHRRHRKKKEEEKETKEEEVAPDEDILALLGEEGEETGEDLLGGEDEDFEELKKLLEG